MYVLLAKSTWNLLSADQISYNIYLAITIANVSGFQTVSDI